MGVREFLSQLSYYYRIFASLSTLFLLSEIVLQNSPYSESDSSLTCFLFSENCLSTAWQKAPAVLLNVLGMSWHSCAAGKSADEWQQHS